MIRIGCTTRPYAAVSFQEACQRIAATGYTDVAVFSGMGVEPDSSREEVLVARAIAQDAGLAPSMLLARAPLELGLKEAVAAYKGLIDSAVTLGAAWLLDLGTGNEAFYEDYYVLMRQVAPYAQQAGVQITLKPHGGITLTNDELIAAYHKVDHPAFGICYDPGNIIYYTKGQERPETHIARVAPLVKTGIIKDCIVRDGKPDVMITPGEGWVDFDAVLSGLVKGGFDGPLYVECVGGESIDEIDRNVRRTLTFVRDILSRLI
ncbi:MAG: sugar phosphate isomerase/epimerase [Anaerolineae bacterium]|nr:sugar phosphate isomerase/epimerase [Anaerolineae bacterium]